MNYEKIYNHIVESSKGKNRKRGKQEYFENHHITPRCMGGSNEKENLVLLTAKEHFLCHRLLCEIYPETKELQFAFWAMCNQRGKKGQRTYTVSARTYERMKERVSEMRRKRKTIPCRGCKKGFERIYSWIREKNYCSRECYISSNGVTVGEVHIYKGALRKFIPKSKLNRYITKGWTEGRLFLQKPVQRCDMFGNILQEYGSVKEATRSGEFGVTGISQCANGKRKTHKGYVWKYRQL